MANEYLVFDRNSFAYEAMRGDFASFAYRGALLYFNECADAGTGSNRAAIQINETWVMYSYFSIKPYVI